MSLLLLFNQTPYHDVLLATAQRLIASKDYEVAVVTAQMACEIFTDRAFRTIFTKKGLPHLDDPIDGFISSYNLGNEKVRVLYTALTGDNIANTAFWPAFKYLVKARNDAIHAGRRLKPEEAINGCAAAAQLIKHIAATLDSLK